MFQKPCWKPCPRTTFGNHLPQKPFGRYIYIYIYIYLDFECKEKPRGNQFPKLVSLRICRDSIYIERYTYIYIYIFLKGPMFLRVTQCSCGHVLTVGPPEPFDAQRSGEMRSRNFGQLVDRVEGHECQTGLGHKC